MKLKETAGHLRRSEVQWTIVPILAAAGLSFVPGFNVLSFYFCLPMGLILAMAGGSVTISAVSRARTADGHPGRGVARGMIHAVLLNVGPLLVITIAHFINGPCDYWFGIGHFVAGPVASSVTGAAVAAACALALQKERHASTAFIVIFVLSFVPNAWSMYFEPSVRFYNPFLGLYPGPIYDELIEVTQAFVVFRLWCVVAAGALLLAVWSIFDGGRGFKKARSPAAMARLSIPALVLAGLSGLLWEGIGAADFTVDRDDIRKELSISRTNSLCTILADGSLAGDTGNIDLLLKDCSYRHAAMAQFFGVPVRPRVTVYVYRDSDQKARLIGARWVEISKPWLNEVHVTASNPGDMILAHEIAHVTAGRLADNFLAMPLSGGLFPDMGMVEGLAVAAAFADEGPSPHEWAAAMIGADMDPDVESLFSPLAFISGGAAASYNTAGSFIRYIHDTYGTPATAALAAGRSFKEATGLEIADLDAGWQDFLLRTIPEASDETMRMRAAARFSDPGVLHRTCPLDVSRILRDALAAWEGGDMKTATALVRDACCVDPDDRGLKRLAARMAFLAGALDDAGAAIMIEDVLRSSDGAAGMADRTAAADLMMIRAMTRPEDPQSAELLARAKSGLRDLRTGLGSGGALRSVCARLRALEMNREAGLVVVRALSDPRPFNEGDADELAVVALRHPSNAELQYLAGRAAFTEGRWDRAVSLFRAARAAGFREPEGFATDDLAGACVAEFTAENSKLLGISAFWAGDHATAAESLATAHEIARFEGDRMLVDEYLDRLH